YDWSNFPWGGNVESNIHVQLMGPRGDGIFDVAAIGISNGWGFNLPTEDVANAFEEAGDIIRRDATLISEEDLVAAGGGVNEPEGGFHDYEGYVRLKYVTRPDETAGSIKELNYAVNWRLIRYADVLLMAAEAYYRDGAEASALTELNKVRDRAGLEDVDASGSALFDAIVTERRLELAFEGQRFWDVVRWGIAGQELSDTQFTSGKNEVFPIPQREVNVNENITPDDQNPGY
ncbi:MAG: RagB/SusD family nutrient uptake outer membrane protein, partial [Prolixibacteraceae bacterium]|nr:RagB/SusD family nutrient uptake outer membrane protein [Prolixibacteraceae bacterium]